MKEFIKTLTFCIAIVFAWYVFFSLVLNGKDEMYRWFKQMTGFYKPMVVQTESGKEIKIPHEYIEIKSVKNLYAQADALDLPSYNKKKLLTAIEYEIESLEYGLIKKLGKEAYLELQEQYK